MVLDFGSKVFDRYLPRDKVLGKEDLITMKRQAGRDKDEFDIQQLQKQKED